MDSDQERRSQPISALLLSSSCCFVRVVLVIFSISSWFGLGFFEHKDVTSMKRQNGVYERGKEREVVSGWAVGRELFYNTSKQI